MRIIAGSKRGMKLFSPVGEVSRPIIDRVKESLFSVLYKYDLPAGAIVADLFCGVGSLGIEALSRAAGFVTFVEKDRKVAEVLERNIAKAGFVKESKVITADAYETAGPPAGESKYDLVFVDPPYADTRDVGDSSALAGLFEVLAGQITPDGIVVVKTQRDRPLLAQYAKLRTIEARQWGTMVVTILGLRRE